MERVTDVITAKAVYSKCRQHGVGLLFFLKHQVVNPKAKERGMGVRERGRVRFED